MVGLLLGPADFGNVIVLCERVQVSVEVLYSLLVGFGCFLQDPFHLPLLLHLLKCRLGRCPLVQSASLLLLVLFARSHRFQEFRLVFVFLFLLPLSHSELCDAFQLQGPLLDLLVGLHGLLESSGRKTPHFRPPKYLGSWTTEKVKGRIIEILFSWTVWFPEDIKIRDAYQMLKKQGIIKQDPKLPVDKILPPPSPWPKSSIFDADEEKSKLLTRLLKSNHPEDLQAANRLIKNLVKEEQEKSEKVSRRVSAVEEVRSHVKVLQEMLSTYRKPGQAPPDQAALQVVYERCEKLRPTLFRLASDTTDDDEALAEILQANDLLTQGVLLYKQVMEGRVTFGNTVASSVGDIPVSRVFQNPTGCVKNCPLIDLEDSGSEQAGAVTPSLLHQDLAALGISDAPATSKVAGQNCCQEKKNPTTSALPAGGAQSPSAERNLLDLLSPQPPPGSLNYIPQKSIPKEVPPGTKSSPGWSWEAGPLAPSPSSQNTPLAQVFVPLESVKPSSLPPLIVYDRNGFRILLHFSQTGAPGHPEVQVLLLTMMSTATQPVWDIMFQVAVPKSMRVKLQPASSSKLPAFSPLTPPAVISQMLLLDNPHKEPIRLRYKLTFNQGGQPFSEVGEVKDFPDLAVLGAA